MSVWDDDEGIEDDGLDSDAAQEEDFTHTAVMAARKARKPKPQERALLAFFRSWFDAHGEVLVT